MKPFAVHLDDGSLLIEWISNTARFGLSLEPALSESSWFYVSKNGEGGCGELPFAFTEYILEVTKEEGK